MSILSKTPGQQQQQEEPLIILSTKGHSPTNTTTHKTPTYHSNNIKTKQRQPMNTNYSDNEQQLLHTQQQNTPNFWT